MQLEQVRAELHGEQRKIKVCDDLLQKNHLLQARHDDLEKQVNEYLRCFHRFRYRYECSLLPSRRRAGGTIYFYCGCDSEDMYIQPLA